MTGKPTVNNTINGFQNKASFGRFDILKDRTWSLGHISAFNDAATTGTQAPPITRFKFVKRWPEGLLVKFNTTNMGDVGDIIDNSFHLMALKNTAGFDTEISYMCRVYFKDP